MENEIIDSDKHYKKYDGLWGESLTQLKSRLVFQRKSHSICLYCGMDAQTREHCPPKCFLKEPYPKNLKVIPACVDCNNYYSKYEKKFKKLVNALETGSEDDNIHSDIITVRSNHTLPEYAKIVLTKVAIGHAVYQLSDGFGDMLDKKKITIDFVIKDQATEEIWNELNKPQEINIMPEIGSRESDIMFIVEGVLEENDNSPLCFVDWTDVQSGVYRYLAYVDNDGLSVKMIIRDVLYVKVSF